MSESNKQETKMIKYLYQFFTLNKVNVKQFSLIICYF